LQAPGEMPRARALQDCSPWGSLDPGPLTNCTYLDLRWVDNAEFDATWLPSDTNFDWLAVLQEGRQLWDVLPDYLQETVKTGYIILPASMTFAGANIYPTHYFVDAKLNGTAPEYLFGFADDGLEPPSFSFLTNLEADSFPPILTSFITAMSGPARAVPLTICNPGAADCLDLFTAALDSQSADPIAILYLPPNLPASLVPPVPDAEIVIYATSAQLADTTNGPLAAAAAMLPCARDEPLSAVCKCASPGMVQVTSTSYLELSFDMSSICAQIIGFTASDITVSGFSLGSILSMTQLNINGQTVRLSEFAFVNSLRRASTSTGGIVGGGDGYARLAASTGLSLIINATDLLTVESGAFMGSPPLDTVNLFSNAVLQAGALRGLHFQSNLVLAAGGNLTTDMFEESTGSGILVFEASLETSATLVGELPAWTVTGLAINGMWTVGCNSLRRLGNLMRVDFSIAVDLEDGALGYLNPSATVYFGGDSSNPQSPPCLLPGVLGPAFSDVANNFQQQQALIPTIDFDDRCVCTAPGRAKLNNFCPQVPAGMIAKDGVAQFCPQGTFNNIPGLSGPLEVDCKKCPAGTFNPLAGETSAGCLQCLAGTAHNTTGATSESDCTPCAPGSYSALPGQFECTPCPQGTFAAGSGANKCTPCPQQTYGTKAGAASRADGCAQCPSGTSTIGSGTENQAGCLPSLLPACPTQQYFNVKAKKCEAITCGASLAPAGEMCKGCPAGSVGDGSTCQDCAPGQLCPGGMLQPVMSSDALKASAPEAAQLQALGVETVPPPAAALLGPTLFFVVTGIVALVLPAIVGTAMLSAPTRWKEAWREGDKFGMDHSVKEGESHILRYTFFGSAFTLSMAVILLSLSVNTVIEYMDNNFLLRTTLFPTAAGVAGIDATETASAGFYLAVAQQAGTTCRANANAFAMLGGDVDQWSMGNMQQRTADDGHIVCTYAASCTECALNPTRPTVFQVQAPFHAQSAVWGLHTSLPWFDVQHGKATRSITEGYATANADAALESADWEVQAIRSVGQDLRDGSVKHGYLVAVSTEHGEFRDEDAFVKGVLPGNADVTYTVTVSVPITAQSTEVSAKMSVLSLLAGLGGLLGGVTGLFHTLFPHLNQAASFISGKLQRRVAKGAWGKGSRRGTTSALPVTSRTSHGRDTKNPLSSAAVGGGEGGAVPAPVKGGGSDAAAATAPTASTE